MMNVRTMAMAVGLIAVAGGIALAQAPSALTRLPAIQTITYFIEEGSPDAAYRAADRQLAVWALEAWARSADGALRFEESKTIADATIRIHWVRAGDGRYGEMMPTLVNGRRGAAVYIRPDTEGLGPEIALAARQDPLLRDAIVYLTCLHELGHALGLSHTAEFADIMYSFGYGGDIAAYFGRYRAQLASRDDIASVSGLSAADVDRIRALYPLYPNDRLR